MAISFTQKQQDAIDAPVSNLLISAAAGSGKTAVLTERVIRMLTKVEPVDASRLVIVTFTVAAAEEMRQRISNRLSALIASDPNNRLLQSQQLLLSSARICTIHSLCSGLIRDNFQKLGLDADFRVADDTELTIIKQDAADEIFGEHYDINDTLFFDLVEFTCVKNDKRLVELVQTIYDFVRSFPFPKEFLHQCADIYQNDTEITQSAWYSEIAGHVTDALQYAIKTIDGALDHISGVDIVEPAYSPALQSDRTQIELILSTFEASEWDKAVQLCRSFIPVKLSPVRKFEDKNFLEEIKSQRKSALSMLKDVTERYLMCTEMEHREDIAVLSPIVQALFGVVEEVYDRIEEKKLTQAVIDYADLEHYALKLLIKDGERSEIALELCDSFEEIMVDECQDINEVQNLIFKLLSKNEHNVFMVGDVKQSIYRFRKAMPTLFIEKKRQFSAYDEATHTNESKATIMLHDNFRSRKEVCETVNGIFARIMSTKMGEIEYNQDEFLAVGAKYIENAHAYSEVHIVEQDSEQDSTEQEAEYIGKMISNMVKNGYKVESGGVMRPCRYGDFAVLLRTKKGKGEVFTKAFKRLGIDSFSDATDGYFNEYEVAVTLNLLRSIDNPLQDICLTSVLMSPMFSFDCDRIASLRIRKRSAPLYLAVSEWAESGDSICRGVIEAISGLRRLSATCTIDQLIQAIYDQTDFISLVYALGNGEQRDANLRLFLTYAKQYEQMGSGGLSGFLRYIDRVIRSKKDFSCANTLSANQNSVKIMSVHSSKGLEFPICILANCAKKFNLRDTDAGFQLNSRLGYGMKVVDKPSLKKYSNLPLEAVRLATLKETISEEMRVLYVALTRAKEKLIMVMTLKDSQKKLQEIRTGVASFAQGEKLSPYSVFSARSYAEWILMSLPYGNEYVKLVMAENVAAMEVQTAAWESKAEISSELAERLRASFEFEYKDKVLTEIPAKLTATQLSKQEDTAIVELKVKVAFLEKEGLTPAMLGTIHHNFMQYADFERASQDLDVEIARLVTDGFITTRDAAVLNRDKLRAFLNSNLYKLIKQADCVHREYKFLHFIDISDVYELPQGVQPHSKIMLQGIADCVLVKDGKLTIIDYKTDITRDEQVLIERYRTQLSIYKAALMQAFDLPVDSCRIYSMHLERDIEV